MKKQNEKIKKFKYSIDYLIDKLKLKDTCIREKLLNSNIGSKHSIPSIKVIHLISYI